jgi:predicted S18 family serine protease
MSGKWRSLNMAEGVMMDVEFTLRGVGDGIKLKEGCEVWRSFYDSVVTAKQVAERVTGKKFDRDIVINPHQFRIDGGSGGMLATLTFISMLTRIPLKPEVTGSGAISEDGIIGSVTSVEEKAEVAKEAGYSVFLLAEGQKHEPIQGLELRYVKTIEEAWNITSGDSNNW